MATVYMPYWIAQRKKVGADAYVDVYESELIICNKTEADLKVTVTLYDEKANVSKVFEKTILPNRLELIQISGHSLDLDDLVRLRGHAVIECDSVGLIAHGSVRKTQENSEYAVPINGGMPF